MHANFISFFVNRWKINIAGFEGTLYEGENFQLLFKFNNKYPFDSPEVSKHTHNIFDICIFTYLTSIYYNNIAICYLLQVTFIGNNIPVHPHVYSNGHICLSILTEDWSPALSVQSVCLSIASMLSSCREKKRPPDNTLYVKTCNKNPKKTKWWYHGEFKNYLIEKPQSKMETDHNRININSIKYCQHFLFLSWFLCPHALVI